MNFIDLIEHSERKEPNNYMVLIENALKHGDKVSQQKLQELMNKENNSLIQKCVMDYQYQIWDIGAELEGSTFIHSKDYVPMECCLCGALMPSIHDTNNPEPLTPRCYAKQALEENLPHRCCNKCDKEMVLGTRLRISATGKHYR